MGCSGRFCWRFVRSWGRFSHLRANESQNIDADGLFVAVKGHEYEGTGGNKKGHQQFLKDKENATGFDAKTKIENNIAATQATLESATGGEVLAIEGAIQNATLVEPSGNWGVSTIWYYKFDTSQWQDLLYDN